MEVLKTAAGLVVLLLLCGFVYGSWDMFRSVVKPKPEEHLHWYDRVLRAISGLILLVIVLYFLWRSG